MKVFFDWITLKCIYRAKKVENGTGPSICVPELTFLSVE